VNESEERTTDERTTETNVTDMLEGEDRETEGPRREPAVVVGKSGRGQVGGPGRARPGLAELEKGAGHEALGSRARDLLRGLGPLAPALARELRESHGSQTRTVARETVGLLLVAVGCGLIRAREEKGKALVSLGRGPALALAGIDLWYAGLRRRISPVYLMDAAVQLGLAASWTAAARRSFQVPSRDAASPVGDLF